MLDNSRRQKPVLRITHSFSFKSKCQACHLAFSVCIRNSSARLGSTEPEGWLWAPRRTLRDSTRRACDSTSIGRKAFDASPMPACSA